MVDSFLEWPFLDLRMRKVTYSSAHSQENIVSYEVMYLDLEEDLPFKNFQSMGDMELESSDFFFS